MATACFGFKGSTHGYEETLNPGNLANLFILGIIHCLSSQNQSAAATHAAGFKRRRTHQNEYSQDDALNAVKSIFWDGDSIKTEKIGFQNAIKEVVEKIRIARELANLLAPFTLYGFKAVWNPDQPAGENEFGVVTHKIRMYQDNKQEQVSRLYDDTTSEALYQRQGGAIVNLHEEAKTNRTLKYAELGHFGLRVMSQSQEQLCCTHENNNLWIIVLGGGEVTQTEFDLAVLNGIVCDWLVLDVKINKNGEKLESGPLSAWLRETQSHHVLRSHDNALGFISSITPTKIQQHDAWYVSIRKKTHKALAHPLVASRVC